jgi:putative membrane protein
MKKEMEMSRFMIAVGVLTAATAGSATAWADPHGSNSYGPHMLGGWHSWFFGPIMMALLLAAIIAAVMLFARWLNPSRTDCGRATTSNTPARASPIEILKERFANGDIDKKEFEDRRDVLEA